MPFEVITILVKAPRPPRKFWVLRQVLLWKSLFEGEIEERMSGAMVDVASILDNAKELDRLKKELEEVFLDINKIHKKLQSGFLPFSLPSPPYFVYFFMFFYFVGE